MQTCHVLLLDIMQLPPLLAIVLGNEARGVSNEMRAAADRYVVMVYFTAAIHVGQISSHG